MCYLELKKGKQPEVGKQSTSNSFTERARFTGLLPTLTCLRGTIVGVNEEGKLRINVGGVERVFGAKEVAFL